MTPQIDCLGKTVSVLRVSTHIYVGFQGERWENMLIFQSKPRHVTPQIDCLWKMIPVLRVSIHIYRVSEEIDGKTFIFRENLGMWPLKSIVLEKMSPVLRVSTHIYGVSKDIGGKTFIFRVNPGMWPLKLFILEKMSPILRVSTHIYWDFQGDRWENIQFLRVNLGMWPLKLIISGKNEHCSEGFNTHLLGFLRR